MSFLEEAKKYLLRGWSVIPLEAKGKKPLVTWKEFQDRQPTLNEAESWFQWENNIGIVTGKISGITVIDCDSLAAIDLASKRGLPTCPTVKTGKGYHFYYAYEHGVGNFQKRDDLPGIDLRGDGGFVVAPPSVHPSGAVYSWEGEARELPPLPKWILRDERKPSPGGTFTDYFQGASLGSRNDTLARMTGFLAKNIPYQDALEFALVWNTRNNPPLPHDEIERTVLSIYRLEGISRAKKQEEAAEPAITNSAEEEQTHQEVFGVSDIWDKVENLYENGVPLGESPGWSSLKPYYTVREGEWTLITGIPGHGKTEFLDAMMINLAIHSKWKFGVFSAENRPLERHAVGLIEKFVGKPFSKGPTERIDKFALNAAKEYFDGIIYFIDPPEKRLSVDGILEIGTKLVKEKGVDCLVIDPWNEMDHSRPSSLSETEYISVSLTKIRRVARSLKIHVFLVAHPMKLQKDKNGKYPVPTPYDVSGSAHWRNKADNCLAVWRDVANEQNPFVQIHIQKVRFKEIGRVGVVDLIYDKVTGRYSDKPWDHGV